MRRWIKQLKRGFNLIEAAIVLAIVGLVIGGIWYAAASVQEARRWSQTMAGWVQIVDFLTGMYKNFPPPPSDDDIQNILVLSRVIPPGWTTEIGGFESQHPVDPYGYLIYAQLQTTGTISVGYNWQTIDGPLCGKMIRWGAQVLPITYPGTTHTAATWGSGACNLALRNTGTVGSIQSACCPAFRWRVFIRP